MDGKQLYQNLLTNNAAIAKEIVDDTVQGKEWAAKIDAYWENVWYCGECGRNVEVDPYEMVCPDCGSQHISN